VVTVAVAFYMKKIANTTPGTVLCPEKKQRTTFFYHHPNLTTKTINITDHTVISAAISAEIM
jgi:hypothetical protein